MHKLSVRRAFAGTGLALRLIHCAIQECNKEGKHFLRLDCDESREKRKALRQNAGVAVIGTRRIQTKMHGTVTAALFERAS